MRDVVSYRNLDVVALLLLPFTALQVDQQVILQDPANFSIAMSTAFGCHLNKPGPLQLLHMAGQCAVGDPKLCRQLIQIHLWILPQKLQQLQPDFRSQCFENLHALFQFCNL